MVAGVNGVSGLGVSPPSFVTYFVTRFLPVFPCSPTTHFILTQHTVSDLRVVVINGNKIDTCNIQTKNMME